MGTTCLLVIDVQSGFLNDYTRKCLPTIHRLIKSSDYDFKIATRFFNPEESLFRKQIGWYKFSSPDDIRIDQIVEQNADIIIDKPCYSAGNQLLELVKSNSIDEVTVVGIDTDVCVLVNAALLFDHNISVRIDTRGCATNGGPEAERAAVKLLKRYVGRNFVIE